MGGGGLYLRGILTTIEKGIQNKARVVRVKICFVLIFMVFNQALKHHNNSNSFQYKPKGVYHWMYFLFTGRWACK